MKKLFTVIMLIFCSLLGTACSCSKDPSISFVHGNISINVGESYTISTDDVKIENSKSEYEIVVLDDDIATVEGNKIIAKKKGITILRFQLVDNYSIKCDVELIVTNIVYAKDISIEKDSIQINMRISTTATNRIFLNEGCTEIPDVTYDESIISYDYLTGKIEAKAEGQTSVIVIFDGCNVSFDVRVVDIAYTTKLIVDDDVIFSGTTGKLNFQVFPYYANTYNFFTTSELINITATGEYEALGVGEVVVYYEYIKAEGESAILGSFKINIIEKIESLNVKIVEIGSNTQPQVFMKDKKYRLKILDVESVPLELFSISGNITCEDIVSAENGLYMDFSFNDSGENIINISLEMGDDIVSQQEVVQVYTSQNMQIKAKWFAVIHDLPEDGKYHLFLTGDSLQPKSLTFVCVIGNVVVNEEIIVYNVTSGERVETTTDFEPTEAGEYTFEFVVSGVTLGNIIIVVEE